MNARDQGLDQALMVRAQRRLWGLCPDRSRVIFLRSNAAAVPRATALRRCESEPAACWATDRTESNEMQAALPSPSEQQRGDRLNATCSTRLQRYDKQQLARNEATRLTLAKATTLDTNCDDEQGRDRTARLAHCLVHTETQRLEAHGMLPNCQTRLSSVILGYSPTPPLCREHRCLAGASRNQRLVMRRTDHDCYSCDTETCRAHRQQEILQTRSKATMDQSPRSQCCREAVPTPQEPQRATCDEYRRLSRATARHR
jgi:hypothetical protein